MSATPAGTRERGRGRAGAVPVFATRTFRPLAAAALAAMLAFGAGGAASAKPGRPVADGESLVAPGPSAARTRALAAWAKRASLDDLLRLLRHGPDRLGPDEAAIAAAALKAAPPGDADLRRRLDARRLLALAESGRKTGRDITDLRALRPRQSVWRIGVVLPDRGDYAGYAATVRAAFEAGLAWNGGAGPFVLEHYGTGDAEPARAAAAVDSAAAACGALVGELLSEPTFAVAAGARMAGLPLVSPTATDEAIGTAGPAAFQIGPAGVQRGEALARAVLGDKFRKVAVFTSAAGARGALVAGFSAAAESLGATIVRRDTYGAGGGEFRTFARGVRTFGADVVFWDGDTREAVTLLRALAAEGVSARVCGGMALAPDQFYANERVLLEGVTYVADDWRLAPEQQAVVDSLAAAREERAGALWTRGFLAGRRLAAAVAAGARTPGALAARLAHGDPGLRAHGFLDLSPEGATLPVWTVSRGKPVEWKGL